MSSNNKNKIKVLFAGCVTNVESATALVRKMAALHTSKKAGPFDIAFSSCSDAAALQTLQSQNICIPLYLQDTTVTTTAAAAASATTTSDSSVNEKEEEEDKKEEEDEKNPCVRLAKNLYVLRDKQTSTTTTSHTTAADNIADDEPQAGIWRIPVTKEGILHHLVVASLPPGYRSSASTTSTTAATTQGGGGEEKAGETSIIGIQASSADSLLQKSLRHVSYTGCDVLLSTEWPQGVETLLPASSPEAASASDDASRRLLLLSSFDVADVALKARARYHVSLMNNTSHSTISFQQSPAFQHVGATTSSTAVAAHTGRFLALCPMHSAKDKTKKCLHAVGIVPLHAQQQQPSSSSEVASAAPCPFTDAVYPVDNSNNPQQQQRSSTSNYNSGSFGQAPSNVGLSDAAARRILAEDAANGSSKMSGTNRWATTTGSKRQRHSDTTAEVEVVDPNNCTLFVYGLHMDVTGRLQSASTTAGGGDDMLLQAFHTAVAVRRPPNAATSSFCFLEFPTHALAAACLQQQRSSAVVAGVQLTLKWATTTTSAANNSAASKKQKSGSSSSKRLTEAEARDSSVVYFKITPSTSSTVNALPSLEQAGEELRLWMEHTLERALRGDADDADADKNAVKAADEPALQVQVRYPAAAASKRDKDDDDKKDDSSTPKTEPSFGFLDFASHAAASMALATLTGSTDGGRVLDEQQTAHVTNGKNKKEEGKEATATTAVLEHVGIYLHWAEAAKEQHDKKVNNVIEDGATGFRFERKHFPADSRKDCWFCLASASCEKHLIVGVYNTCYAAMPKGPVHPGHVLLVPVQHSSQGALYDPVVAAEMEELKNKLRKHAANAYNNADLFVFERAIQTKGGYHTHVQCIPVERNLGLKLQATMLAQARKLQMDLREINSDVGLRAILSSSDDDNANGEGGYFYAEIPVGNNECKRFLYKATSGENHSRSCSSVPLQFGREVLAAVLGKPELAHWKSCLVDQEQEATIAATLRESFAKQNE